MHRRVSRDDVRSAISHAIARQEQQESNGWAVCEDYELQDGAIVPKYPILKDGNALTKWRGYKPLEKAPNLFLELTRLYQEQDFAASALRFSRKYGLLGGSSYGRKAPLTELKLADLKEEAARAWKILRLYEAVLNADASTARAMTSRHERMPPDTGLDPDYLEALYEEVETQVYKEAGPRGLEQYFLMEGLGLVVTMVNDSISDHCSFQAYAPGAGVGPERFNFNANANTVRSTWRFKNLLGAAYLQMYWLMTSEGELKRCENCGRTVSLARPHPQGRKRRRDKRFCDDACRQAHHRSKKKT